MSDVWENTCDCGSNDFAVSATLIKCKTCGRIWGRVNGAWVLDPDTVPGVQESPVKIARDHRARVEGLFAELSKHPNGDNCVECGVDTSGGKRIVATGGPYCSEKCFDKYGGKQPCGLTFDQLTVACRNIGFDLTCVGCAANFFTGTGASSHDEGCKTLKAPERLLSEVDG